MISRAIIAVAALAALAACTSPAQQRINRERQSATAFLERQGSIGDPGRVAAADFAFARMARDEGTWTAFRAYAAPDAVMDTADGWEAARVVLAGLEDPAEPIRWAPTKVWSSCDGRLAVSEGRFLRPNGLVGTYITVWELQNDNSYKWIYDTGTPDDPQPAPEVQEDLPEDAIVVPGLTALEGLIADCQRAGEAYPIIPQHTVEGVNVAGGDSRDGSLRWSRWVMPDGTHMVRVDWVRGGAVETAVELAVPGQ